MILLPSTRFSLRRKIYFAKQPAQVAANCHHGCYLVSDSDFCVSNYDLAGNDSIWIPGLE